MSSSLKLRIASLTRVAAGLGSLPLLVVHREYKQVDGWWKMMVLFSEQTPEKGDARSIFGQLTANSESQLLELARPFRVSQTGIASKMELITDGYNEGHYLALGPKKIGGPRTTWKVTEDDLKKYPSHIPEPIGTFKDLVMITQDCRCSLLGKVVLVGIKRSPNDMVKNVPQTLWLKDMTDNRLSLELYGSVLLDMNFQVGQIIQVHNARALPDRTKGNVKIRAEAFTQGKWGYTIVFLNPQGPRALMLREMVEEHGGTNISDVVAQVTMTVSGKTSVECLSTIRTNRDVWPGPAPSNPAAKFQKLHQDIRCDVERAVVTQVDTKEPVYQECSICKTKIDPETGACKKQNEGCATNPGEMQVLMSCTLSDCTGSMANLLAKGDVACTLLNVSSLEQVQDLIRNNSSLTFRTRANVRIWS